MTLVEDARRDLVYVTFRGRTTTWGLPGQRVEQVAAATDADVERVVDLAGPLDLDPELEPARTLILSGHRRRVGVVVHGPLELMAVERDQLQPVPSILRRHGAAGLVSHVVLGVSGPSFLSLDADLLCSMGEEGDARPA